MSLCHSCQPLAHSHGLLVQSQLERSLFSIMEEAGFGDEYVKRYKMVSAFFRQRRPLIVQLCGAPCTGVHGAEPVESVGHAEAHLGP